MRGEVEKADSATAGLLLAGGEAREDEATRRRFLQQVACLGLGGCALLGPVVAGAVVVAHPLIEKEATGLMVRLAGLDDLPVDGAPQLYQVLAEPTAAWLKFSRGAIGSVFLMRTGENQVQAFNAACPHVSEPITWRDESKEFHCPLHSSRFSADGARLGADSPSPRDLDALDVELRDREVWVRFQNFTPNKEKKRPV
ncbi:MAG: ubiquinol-cytochrome c reductase iron-sulfur subunit [Verrucomicrobiales bacterium]